MPEIEKNPDLLHAPGIYFGLSEEIYHADTALGSTDIKLLSTKPWSWQYGRKRPTVRKTTAAMVWGSAWHCRVLEGDEEFKERYRRKPDPKDYQGCLVTVDDLKQFLRERDQPVSKLKKEELIASVEQFLDHPVIFDRVVEEFNSRPRVSVSPDISPDIVQEIEDAVSNMERDPILRAVMRAGSLIDGAAEVSIFYEVDGVRRKARLDYAIPPIEPRKSSLIVDLKSFTSFKGRDLEDSAIRHLWDMGYDVQAADYTRAFGYAADLAEAGKVFNEPAPGFAASLFNADVDFVWVMMKRDEAMLPVVLSIDTNDIAFRNAELAIDRAYENYRFYMTRFGPDRLWTPDPKAPRRLTYADLPAYERNF